MNNVNILKNTQFQLKYERIIYKRKENHVKAVTLKNEMQKPENKWN